MSRHVIEHGVAAFGLSPIQSIAFGILPPDSWNDCGRRPRAELLPAAPICVVLATNKEGT